MKKRATEKRMQVRMPLELAASVEQEAEKMGVSRSVVIRWAVEARYQSQQEVNDQILEVLNRGFERLEEQPTSVA